MLVDKSEFKQLKHESGGIRGVKCMIIVTHSNGLNYLKTGNSGNLSVMDNGVYFDSAFSKKVFIPIGELINIEIDKNNLILYTTVLSEEKIVLISNKPKDLIKFFNEVAKLISIDEMPEKEFLQMEKERKKKIKQELAGVRASYSEVSTKKVENDNVVHCSKCGSTSISANKKGFSLGKALVGSVVALPVGAVTGMMGKNKIYITCLNCGHKWKPGGK